MKRTLISLICLVAVNFAYSQQHLNGESAEPQNSVNIALDEINRSFTPSEVNVSNLKSANTLKTFEVSFENFPEEAKGAFLFALSIWDQKITSPIKIRVLAKWENLSNNTLGEGKPAVFYRNFRGTPVNNVFYPVALAEKITGREINKTDEADIICSFNKTASWYFGENGQTPETKYDFVTAVLHEIGHGLGVSGFFKNDNGIAQYSNSTNAPAIYDYYIFNRENLRIADNSIFPCPSVELTNQLTSNSLNINHATKSAKIESIPVYAPTTWLNGISIYHLKSTENTDEFMKAYAFKGEAIHKISEGLLSVLAEIGWDDQTGNVSTTTANNEEKLGTENVNVYPNPCRESLTFDCMNLEAQSTVEIKITDLMGRVVFNDPNCDIQFNPSYKVDLSSVKSGVYLASIKDMNNNIITKRIIKQ